MKKAKKEEERKRNVSIGGAFELVDSINEYARRKNSVLGALAD
ncbi:MAG: hypothetical protein WCY41_00435 [Candidatus Micrarchaeia archaeon]